MSNTDPCFDCGGKLFHCSFIFPETAKYLEMFLDFGTEKESVCDISVTQNFMQENRWLVNEDETSEPYLEFQALMLATGNALLEHQRALFHGVAFCWKECAWILTAPSGTGKTTQLRHWRKLLKKEVRVINGDKPLLECREDGSVWVHSSPWRGKEKLSLRGLNAPLGGIILLEQGKENRISRILPGEAVVPLFVEFVSLPENTGQILGQAQVLRQMLDAVPVWKLVNVGDEDSALLTQQTILRYLEGMA